MVVSKIVSIFMMLAFFSSLSAQGDVQVSAAIEQENIYESRPLRGIITITHPENLKIDEASFTLENASLQAELVKSTKISPDNPLTITIFRFEIPGKSKGLYFLPEISVSIDGKTYQSFPSTYEVRAAQPQMPALPAPSSPLTPKEASLKLEADVVGKTPLYPGQRLTFVYRFFFSGNIALTHEVLPLLEAEGFLKIGDKEIKDYEKDHQSINEISQVVEAVKPGDFSFGPSVIEGNAYQEDSSGHRTYSKTPLKSEAPAIQVTVKPFPEEGKPASFNGAIGPFTFDVALKSSQEVNVGDEMTLSVDVKAKEHLNTVVVPEFCCQPGFSGFFRLSDLPPTSDIKGDTKNFIVKLRPLTDLIKEIPSVEFSYFDPKTERYVILHSDPIAIIVKPSKSLPVEDLDKAVQQPQVKTAQGPLPTEAIQIQRNFVLTPRDLSNKIFGTWWTMLIITLGIALLIYQFNLRDRLLKKQQEEPPVKSTDLFEKAFLESSPTPVFFDLLNKAFKQALVEAKEIPQSNIGVEDLPNTGLSQEVRKFLTSIDERRFTGQGNVSPAFLQGPAKALFEKIQKDIQERHNAN